VRWGRKLEPPTPGLSGATTRSCSCSAAACSTSAMNLHGRRRQEGGCDGGGEQEGANCPVCLVQAQRAPVCQSRVLMPRVLPSVRTPADTADSTAADVLGPPVALYGVQEQHGVGIRCLAAADRVGHGSPIRQRGSVQGPGHGVTGNGVTCCWPCAAHGLLSVRELWECSRGEGQDHKCLCRALNRTAPACHLTRQCHCIPAPTLHRNG
jgi:hypothetical protein